MIQHNETRTVSLPAGYALTIAAGALSTGRYWVIGNPGSEPGTPVAISASADTVVDASVLPRNIAVFCAAGSLTYAMAPAALPVAVLSASDVLNDSTVVGDTLADALDTLETTKADAV